MTLCLHQHTHFHFPNTHTHTHKHTCRCVTAFFTEVCVLSTCEAFKAARGLTMCLSAPHVHDNTCTSIIGATGSVAENCFPERHFLFQMMMSHIVSHTLIAHPERWRRKHSVLQQQIVRDRTLVQWWCNTAGYERSIKPSSTLWCEMITTDV